MKKCKIDTWNIFRQCHEDPINIFCQNFATMEVHDLSGRIIGKACPYHAKQTEMMSLAVNGIVTAKFVARN